MLITNPADPRLDDFRDLRHADRRTDLVYAEGPLIIERLLASRFPVRSVVGYPEKLADLDLPPGVPVYAVDRETLSQVVGYDMHRGLLAVAERTEQASISTVLRANTIVVLEGVGDHENIGAIFRNAAGLGVGGVLLGVGCADPLFRRSVRVSIGHTLTLPFARLGGTSTTWQRGLSALEGFRLISLTPAGEPLPGALVDASGRPWPKVALLLGGEGPGLTEHAMRATHARAAIPMAPGADSLNVATSGAIAFYERARSLGL